MERDRNVEGDTEIDDAIMQYDMDGCSCERCEGQSLLGIVQWCTGRKT